MIGKIKYLSDVSRQDKSHESFDMGQKKLINFNFKYFS